MGENKDERLNVREVMGLVGLGRTSIYALMEQGKFPSSIRVGAKSVVWRLYEIELWMKQKICERTR
ncbi:AlpA family phage regulatory protein [Vibrio splendidus]|uniref:helix-turn-helix transcriptional regulator n=1 Tax=Vibrio splendidus TaxID=29497 RepID=UPI00246909BE|nr:AlpA family phage regulatory protein [Vibrio splendidus]MDH5904612.1 AlpA family phage regulatory protein [Vibrio splendidus]